MKSTHLFPLLCATLACGVSTGGLSRPESARDSPPPATSPAAPERAPLPRATADLLALLGELPSDAELEEALAHLTRDPKRDDARSASPRSRVDKRRDVERGDGGVYERAPEAGPPKFSLPPPAWLDELGLEPRVAKSLLASVKAESWFEPESVNGYLDDRYDPADLEADARRDADLKAELRVIESVALMLKATNDEARLVLPATDPLGKRERLCEGESFADQPSYDGCSAVLIGPDLIATAGHCVEAPASDYWFVFNYATGKNLPSSLVPRSDAYRGRCLVAEGLEDWALIRLDRVVTGRSPVPIRPPPKARGPGMSRPDYVSKEYVFSAGHPSGLPLKFVQSGRVLSYNSQYLRTNLDLFRGNSGSPVFARATRPREMIGLVIGGRADYTETDNSCYVVNRCLEADACIPNEQAVRADVLYPYLLGSRACGE